MMALYGPLVFFDGELLTPVLEVFLDLAFVLLALRAMESQSPRQWVGAGLALGLAAIARPNILVVTPVVLVWMWVRETSPPPLASLRSCPLQGEGGLRSAGSPGHREVHRPKCPWSLAPGAFGAAALFLAGAALAPGLVTVRNYRVSGDPVFIASQGGINLYLGNRPGADGFTPSTPRRYRFAGPYEDSVALYGQRAAEEATGRPLSASAAQAYWLQRVAEWWREDPADALKLTGRKLVLAWSHREIRNNHAYDFIRSEFAPCLWFCPFGFWFAGPLGLLGITIVWWQSSRWGRGTAGRGEERPPTATYSEIQNPKSRIQNPQGCFLAWIVLIYVASFVTFFVADRYRLPVVPLLLLFGAEALVWIGEQLRGKEWGRLAPAGVALAGLALFVNADWYRTATPATSALDYWSAGNGYQEMGRLAQAEVEHRKALALDPRNPEIWTNLGVDQYGAGRVREAAVSFQQALSLAPRNGTACYDLAMCELQLRHPQEARRLLEEAVRVEPEYTRARAELARLERQ
jgi:tetratricopeptide (TPR) repeat protein